MNKKLKLKGLGVPRIFIWFLGFFHGHVLKTAVVDSESGLISSGYITEKCKLFNRLSSEYVGTMENELKAIRADAAKLMSAEMLLRKEADAIQMPGSIETVAEKRAAGAAAANMSACKKEHNRILERLVEIDGEIVSRELTVREELDAAASALQAVFAVYARGMLVRPVRASMIPPVGYERCFELYHAAHEKEEQQMAIILREVYENEKR